MARVWADDAPAPKFDVTEDITGRIFHALYSASPPSTLRDLWPWVPRRSRLRFVVQARTAQRDGDLTVLMQRYQHTVRAEWIDRYEPLDTAWTRVRKVFHRHAK